MKLHHFSYITLLKLQHCMTGYFSGSTTPLSIQFSQHLDVPVTEQFGQINILSFFSMNHVGSGSDAEPFVYMVGAPAIWPRFLSKPIVVSTS